MGRKCAVPDCLSEEGRSEDRGVTFHKIPLHPDIRPKWMSLCHIPEDKYNIKVIHVCSRHFLKMDFCNFKGKKYMLRQGVLPSVFPWNKLKRDTSATHSISVKKETTLEDASLDSSNNQISEDTIKSEFEIKEEPQNLDESAVDIKDCILSSGQPNDFQCDLNSSTIEDNSSTTIEQKGKSIQTSSGILNFTINTRLEALDFNQMWFPARIIEIDYEESEVLIHFEKYSSKYDEWISMNSSRLRPLQPMRRKAVQESYVEGEKCMASWSDSRKFPATISKVIDKDTYEVLFSDGFTKVLKSHRIAKAYGKVVGSAPLFDPAIGSKQDRRDKKRKINIAELFRKRGRTDAGGDEPTSTSPLPPSVNEETVAPTPEEIESWLPKWENGRPLGAESVIETSDGLKKSFIVGDPRLPPNWQKHLMQRTCGISAGKWDTIILSPEGRKFRTRTEIKSFLEENPQLNYTESMFDFSLHRRSRARRSTAAAAAPVPEVPPPPPEPEPEPSIEEEETASTNSLKIPIVNDTYKCPIEGCGKTFRRENLAQMHVKHYHPKYTKYLDSTPNVADLAYARTVGESLDKSPDRASKNVQLKQGQKSSTPKAIVTPKTTIHSPLPDTETKNPPQQPVDSDLQKAKDSEILKLLSNKPSEDLSPKYPPGLPSSMYPDIKLKDLLNKSEGIPKQSDLNLKSLSASTTRPTGIKTLLPVIRTKEIKKEDNDDSLLPDHDPWSKTSINRHTIKHGIKRKKQLSEGTERTEFPLGSIKQETTQMTETNPNYIVEGGEVIKIVRMKREEIINCTCGITEEDGLMIQCELCLCWQHAYCNNIERENQVPEKYICYICQNPDKQRMSRKYFHDQDWLKNGTLPVANYHCKDHEMLKKRFEKLKKSHDLSGRLIELKSFINSLKIKLKIAESKNHQKLYLWSKPWDKQSLPEKIDTRHENLVNNKNDSMLFSILKPIKEEQKIKEELDLNTFMDNNLEQLPLQAPIIPQPEAAIESEDCKINLLDHIAHSQNLVEERLNNIETQVDALEEFVNETPEDFNRTCQTVQMLLRDLNTLKELSHSNNL